MYRRAKKYGKKRATRKVRRRPLPINRPRRKRRRRPFRLNPRKKFSRRGFERLLYGSGAAAAPVLAVGLVQYAINGDIRAIRYLIDLESKKY